MASLSRVGRETSVTIVFILTVLVTWISNVGSAGDELNDDDTIEVGTDDDVFFEIVDPPELSYTYRIRPARNFGSPFNASFSGRRIALVPVEPATGCRKPDNVDKLDGSVALVWRGDCTFLQKSVIAEDAGAKAIIVADYYAKSIDDERNSPMWMDYYYVEMTIDDDVEPRGHVNISAGFMLGKNGKVIRDTLKRLELSQAIINIPVNLTFARITDFRQPPWVAL